jgi:transcription initiation factor IIE alpha subunit
MANELLIVDQDEAEEAEYYVCMRASEPARFDDDLYDFCCRCGEKVRYRPHGPKIPKKVCYPCITDEMEQKAKDGELGVMTTEQVADEVRNFFKRN